jgi:hypothetical protein
MFQKATKRAVRARIALDGPSGSGKTWTALTFAREFGKRTALVDSERGSASLYADRFDFDVIEMSPPYHPDRLITMIQAAEKEGYDSLVIDSLSHFWEGEGGVLDIVDAAGARANNNTWAGWKTGSPILRHLIDTILSVDLHVIVTMRSKQEWVLQDKVNKQGRTVQEPTRVGMAPVMRAGMEYEFTLVGDLDLEHRLTITKSRVDVLADQVIQPGRATEAAEAFMSWMSTGAAVATREQIDGLKQRMNKIEPGELRKTMKVQFADQFGNPDYLLADKLPEAEAFIRGYEGNDPAAGDSVAAESTPANRPSDPAPALADFPESGVDEPTAPAKPKAKRSTGSQIHAQLGAMGIPQDYHRKIVLCETEGRTDSTADLDEATAFRVIQTGRDIQEGRRSLEDVDAAVAEWQARTVPA